MMPFPDRVREGDRHRLQGRQGHREGAEPVPAALQGGARPRRHPELPPEGGVRHERRVGPLAANTGIFGEDYRDRQILKHQVPRK